MVSPSAVELGRSAVAAGRWREACERFAEARSVDTSALSVPDLELLSMALFLRGQHQAAREELTRAHESYLKRGDQTGAARTAGWLALQSLEAGEVAIAGTWVSRGVRLAEPLIDSDTRGEGALVSLIPAALTAMFVGDVEEAIRRFDGIAAVAERSGDRELAAYAAFGRGKSLATIGRAAEGFTSLDQAMDSVADGDVGPVGVCILYRAALDVCHEGFDVRRAEAWTSAFATWCDSQPELIAYRGQADAYRAQLLLFHGAWAEASAAATLASDRLRSGDFTAAYVAELHRLRGELHAAQEHYRRAGQTGWDPQPGLGLVQLARGEPEAARAMIRNSAAGTDEATRRRLLPALVHIEIAAGDVAAARRAADELIPLARSVPTPMLAAVARSAEAQVLLAEGDTAGARESVDTALASWSLLDAPYEVARGRMLKGRILIASDESRAAATELEAARACFLELGARSDLAQLSALTGLHLAPALTSREVEVLRLVSTGLTNRSVAERLSLSEKTVARHLSNIFGKLGLSSRAAATSYAYEHGLIRGDLSTASAHVPPSPST